MRARNHFRLIQKKRYEARRFSNPYFQHKPKRNWKLIAGLVLTLGILTTTCWFFLGSRYFSFWNVTVTGTETIPPEQITGRVWQELKRPRLLVLNSDNRFLFSEERLRASLLSSFSFKTLEIAWSCQWIGGGCSMSVAVEEKTSQLLWLLDDRVYLADLQGTVIRELTTAEIEAWRAPVTDLATPPDALKRLPIFRDVNAVPVEVGDAVLKSDEVENIFSFHERLRAMGIEFVETQIDRLAGKWMSVKTVAGYSILFDAAANVGAQADNLAVLLRDTIKETSGLEYIDLRFGDHVYYK
jgi:hypothetical protein